MSFLFFFPPSSIYYEVTVKHSHPGFRQVGPGGASSRTEHQTSTLHPTIRADSQISHVCVRVRSKLPLPPAFGVTLCLQLQVCVLASGPTSREAALADQKPVGRERHAKRCLGVRAAFHGGRRPFVRGGFVIELAQALWPILEAR